MYDAIVIGARCGGAGTAMLLARAMALGICDALRDAEWLSEAVVDGLSAPAPRRRGTRRYARRRDEAKPAGLPPEPRDGALRAAVRAAPAPSLGAARRPRGNPPVLLTTQGMIAPQTFFNDKNLRRIIAGAAGVPADAP